VIDLVASRHSHHFTFTTLQRRANTPALPTTEQYDYVSMDTIASTHSSPAILAFAGDDRSKLAVKFPKVRQLMASQNQFRRPCDLPGANGWLCVTRSPPLAGFRADWGFWRRSLPLQEHGGRW
jgi:hypothetical protein